MTIRALAVRPAATAKSDSVAPYGWGLTSRNSSE
jgi:hypothetical protein